MSNLLRVTSTNIDKWKANRLCNNRYAKSVNIRSEIIPGLALCFPQDFTLRCCGVCGGVGGERGTHDNTEAKAPPSLPPAGVRPDQRLTVCHNTTSFLHGGRISHSISLLSVTLPRLSHLNASHRHVCVSGRYEG